MDKKLLKMSFIKKILLLHITRICLYISKKDFSKEKILIKSCDGIGDILIRTGLVEKLFEKYGKENCVFLFPENYLELGEILGYNCIPFYGDNPLSSNSNKENLFLKFIKMKKLNKMGFSKYINLEYWGDTTMSYLFIPERIGRIDNRNVYLKYCNKYYTKKIDMGPDGYILENIRKFGESILEKKISIKEITPNLKFEHKNEESGISIGVGASSIIRTCAPQNMCEYVKCVIEKYPKEKIYLLGVGKLQREYADQILNGIKNKNIINLVGKTTLKESFERVAASKIFIGFDSGLYNLAFILKKQTIAIFRKKNKIHFIHNEPWVNVLLPSKNIYNLEDKKVDCLYNDYLINNITVEQFKDALNKLNEDMKC